MTWLPTIGWTVFAGLGVYMALRLSLEHPVAGRIVGLMLAPNLSVVVYLAAIRSEMITDDTVVLRCAVVFGFRCVVVAVSCPPTMGIEILFKAWLLGMLSAVISVACQWSYQFAAEYAFEEPRLPSLILAVSTPIFVFWSLMSEIIEHTRPKEQGRIIALLAKDPFFTVFGVICSAVGVILAVWPWETILAAVHRGLP